MDEGRAVCMNPHLHSLSLQEQLNPVSSPSPSYPATYLDPRWSQTGSSSDPASN